MPQRAGRPEGSFDDASFLWWDGERWTEMSRPGPPAQTAWQPARDANQSPDRHARRYFPENERAIDRFYEGSLADRLRETPAEYSGRRDADDRRDSSVTLTLSALFAVSLVVLLAGYGLDNAALRLGGVLGALFFGVGGVPLRAFRRAGLTVRLALALLLGLSVPTLVASVMALTPFWHPLIAAVLLGIVMVILHVRASREALAKLRAAGQHLLPVANGSSWLNLSSGLTAAGNVCWIGAVVISGRIDPGSGGFLTQIAPLWYAGLLLVLGGIVLARGRGELAAIIGVVSLAAALTMTPAFVYGLPRIQTAAKHVGFVQQLLGSHYLDRHAGIYQAYSGFFALSSWICAAAGVKDSMGLATYWPCIIDIAGLAVLRFFFGVLLRSGYRIYVALALTFLTEVVGQDYFSPQSVGYVLVFGVYALALGGEQTTLSRRTRIGLVLLISCAAAVTHELSPFIGAAVLAIFVAAKLVRPVYLPMVALPAILWALLNWSVTSGFISIYHLGDLANFQPPKTVAAAGLQRLPIVAQASDALLAGLVVLVALATVGFLAAVSRWSRWGFFRPAQAWAMSVSAGAGLGLIVANPYGNEGIFRAVLFAIPWLAALAVTSVPRVSRNWAGFSFAMLLTGLTATFCVSSFGLDNAGVIRQGDIQALGFYASTASSRGYILDLSYGDTPTGMIALDAGHSVSWTSVVPQSGGHVAALSTASAALLARNYLAYVGQTSGETNELYAIWSPASVNYAVDYGLESNATAIAWRQALSSSNDWKLVYENDDTYLFQLALP
jgi:hypothetical protein